MDQNIIQKLKGSARRAGGKKARRAGERFEDAIVEMHRIYRMEGRAIIDQCHRKTAGNGPTLRIVGRAPLDNSGTLKGGRSVLIEAKSTALHKSGNPHGTLEIDAAPVLPGKECGGIQYTQVCELQERARLGALCLIVWWNGREMGVLEIPHDWQPTGPSLKAEMFTWLPAGSFDWLSVVNNGGAL